MEGGRKGVFFLRAFAQRATPKYHNYVETQNTGKKKREREECYKGGKKKKAPGLRPQKGYHIGGNKKSGGGKMRKKSRLRPQLSGYHRGGFSGSPRKKTQFEHTEDLCGGVFNFIGGEREKKWILHIVRGSRTIGIIHFQKTTFNATIGTLFLFSIRMPKRGVTDLLLFKVCRVKWCARGGQNRHRGGLEGFQLNLRLRNEFIAGAPWISETPWEGGYRHKPSTKRRQRRVEDGENTLHPPCCIEQPPKIAPTTNVVPGRCQRQIQTG